MNILKKSPFKYRAAYLLPLPLFIILNIITLTGCNVSFGDISFNGTIADSGGVTDFPPENYGYIIYDIQSEKIVKGHNIRKEFIPASVTKIFTSLFAAETLGYDYTFPTTVSCRGRISEGTLNGDIYLSGGGDPELSLAGLLELVRGLKSKKLKAVNGNFYYDESLFDPREKLDSDMPDDAYYNAGISPLSFNSNNIYAVQRKDPDGKIISAGMLPALPGFNSYLYSGDYRYPFFRYIYTDGKETWGMPDRNLWDSRQQLPVKHPGLYTAQTLRSLCEIHGIQLPPPSPGRKPRSADTLAEYNSSPLRVIIKNMLFNSSNMTAEIIHRLASEKYTGGKNHKDKSAMEKFYSSGFTGLDWDGFRIVNASGLTDLNRATPEQTASVILYLEKHDEKGFTAEELFPVSGWEGTMRNRLDTPDTAFRIYAKTGSIFYASGLAGIFYAKSGRKYIFSIYINDSIKRTEYNSKTSKTADDLNRGGAWSKKSATSIDKFIADMIEEL